MKARWFAPALLLATITVPAQAQFAIDITVGPNWSSISEVPAVAPAGSTKESDVGYFLGGRIRFGHMFYLAPGLDYQYQSFKLQSTNPAISDNIGISSFMVPVEVGVNLNAKIIAVQLGVAGTVAFNSSVSANAFGTTKDNTNNTRWGWMLNAGARILMLQLNLQYQADFTNTFKDDPTGAKLSQFRLGLGIGF
jgi:Outer membrane protein beta-barrel domain